MRKEIGKKMLSVFLATGMAVGMMGCGNSSSGGDTSGGDSEASKFEGESLVFLGYGGSVQEAMEKAWIEPFEEKYGVTVESVSPPDTGQLQAMGEAGSVDYDVCLMDPSIVMKFADLGYMESLEDIDKTDIPEDYYGDNWIAADIYTTSICWNTDSYKGATAPETWADLWDDNARKGDLTMYNYPMLTLESALVADGVTEDELYPLDLDRAFAKLDEVKDSVRTWYDTGEQSAQVLSSGEVAAGGLWVGRALAAKENGDPVDVTFNQSIIGIDSFGVFKDCANPELAKEFIKFALEPEQGAAFMEQYPYGVANSGAYDLVSEEAKKEICVLPEYRDTQFVLDYKYWYKNESTVVDRWNSWITE